MSPLVGVGIILIEQMILAVEIDEPVRVVGPILFGTKVKLWPVINDCILGLLA
jgi:hypothetical protein